MKTKLLGIFVFLTLALAFSVSALEFENVTFQPSLSNTTYQINITNAKNVSINETHLGINDRYTSLESGLPMNVTIINLNNISDPAFEFLYDINYLIEGTFNVDVSTDWIQPTALFINDVLKFSPLSITGTTNLSITEYPDNIIEIFVKDQETGLNITQNVTVKVQTDEDEISYVIENGTRIIRNISDSVDYRLIFTSDGYEQKIYEFASTTYYNELTIYLVNSSNVNAQTVLFGITDQSDEPLEGVNIKIESIVSGVYVTVDNIMTDITGFSSSILDTNLRHRITLSKTGYTTQTFFLNEPLDTSYSFRLADLINIVYETEYDGVNYAYSPADPSIFNRTYNITWRVTSDETIARFRFVTTVFDENGTQVDQIINDSFTDGGTLTGVMDLGPYVGGRIESYYCFKKSGFDEVCVFITKNIEEDIDEKNFRFLKEYVGNNVTLSERLVYWLTATIITGMILIFIPFMRGIFMIVPLGVFSLFYAWLFLPNELTYVVGFFITIGVFYLFMRGER